ncbi:MAG: PEP-CTERM sorting domain-containing protein, partial [Planctomycetales bacterium]|nr:PEP-CTERM sorting domain-containing protein [Planctomycetales bacterium]
QVVWGNTGLGSLDTAAGNPGQSADHPGGTDNIRSFTAFSPTATEHLRLTGQMFDDASSANKRMSIGLRNSNSTNIIEMGFYNSPAHYAARVVLFASGNPSPSWVAFPNLTPPPAVLSTPVAGWHTFSVEISDTTVDFSLDLGSDGTIDSTMNFTSTAGPSGFNELRIGGPSSLSSAGGGAKFDNLLLETVSVPEPTSAGLCVLLGCLGLVRRRRR